MQWDDAGRKRVLALAATVATLCLALAATPAWAQQNDPPKRPKLGLVLSGGGAMGIAHVGVIQTLEKLGIRPDFVVGTSMGSIVGGLYASGMNGAELEQAVKTMNWDLIFDASPPRDGLTYREKQLQAAFPIKGTFGVHGKRILPPEALISDANLLLELRRLVGARAAAPSFDQLPIPFRAVATDIETGEKVVLDRGEMAGAMRASMSVPGVFAPYRLNGKLLVDGGMSDNAPVDVAREMGADVVIVVATQSPMAKADELNGLPAVLGQTVTMLILANERQQLSTLKPSDVLIKVNTAPLTAADFKKGGPLIESGRKAAEGELANLQRVAATRVSAPAVSVKRPPPRIDYVKVENDSRLSDQILLRRVQPLVGSQLSPEAVSAAMRDIYAMGMFSRVDYRIEEVGGRTGLVVDAAQRPGDANRIRPGLTIASTSNGRTQFEFSAEFRMVQLDSHGSEARFVAGIGEIGLLSADYFKVLDNRQRWFVNPAVTLQKRPVVVYDSGGFRKGEYDVGYGLASVAVGRQFGTVGEIRIGIEGGAGEAKVQEGVLIPRQIDLHLGELFLSAATDTLDNPYFYTRGLATRLDWTVGMQDLGSDNDFQTVRLAGLYAKTWGRHALILNAVGGDTVQGALPISSLFTLGGPFNFPGYAVDELSGETFAAARAMYRFKITNSSQTLFNIPLYAGATLVAGNTWARHGDANLDDVRFGANLFVAADTAIGPMFFTIGAADDGRTAAYLFIGKPF